MVSRNDSRKITHFQSERKLGMNSLLETSDTKILPTRQRIKEPVGAQVKPEFKRNQSKDDNQPKLETVSTFKCPVHKTY